MKGEILGTGRGEDKSRTEFHDLGIQPDGEGSFIHQGVKFFKPIFGGTQFDIKQRALQEYLRGKELSRRVSECVNFPPWIQVAKTIAREGDREISMVLKRGRIFKQVIEGKTGGKILSENRDGGLTRILATLTRKMSTVFRQRIGAFGMDIDPIYAGAGREISVFDNIILSTKLEAMVIEAAKKKLQETRINTFLDRSLASHEPGIYAGVFDFGLVSLRGFSKEDDRRIHDQFRAEMYH